MISHGTHVAGTISARRNGVGVIGVIPDGAEVYMIRVFNDSGDVNQGQGLVYGSTLILAYTQCEGRLAALQVSRGGTEHSSGASWQQQQHTAAAAKGRRGAGVAGSRDAAEPAWQLRVCTGQHGAFC
jgi:serine protease